MLTTVSNQADQNTTQETYQPIQIGDLYGSEDYLDQDEQFIELLEDSKDEMNQRGGVQGRGNYLGSNKYSISQQETIQIKKANKKSKNFKMQNNINSFFKNVLQQMSYHFASLNNNLFQLQFQNIIKRNKTPFLMGEKPFVFDVNTHKSNTLSYNPLQDEHLKGYFLNKNVRKVIKQNQLVDKEGKILDKYYVKVNSSKDSQSNPKKNIAYSFQLNLSNDQLYKDEINKFFDSSKAENEQQQPSHQRNNMKIETLQDDNEIKQELLKSYESPRDRRRVKQLNASQKQLIQQGIYQQTYLQGNISDRNHPSSNRTNVKSACGGYPGITSYNFKNDQIKCKTPDPYTQNKLTHHGGFKTSITPTPNKTIHSQNTEMSIANNTNSNNTLQIDTNKQNLEERKKMLQERKQLIKKQQLELARAQAIQVQIKLAKQKELQQQKLLLIQKQEQQIQQYKLLMSASQSKIGDHLYEKSPSNNLLNNNSHISNQNSIISHSNVSNYLSKSPIIPTKLFNGKRPKLSQYQVNDTYTQFDKQLFQQKRCQSVESNHQNQSNSFSQHPNVANLQNESFDNKTILQKLNQNMIQIQQLQTQSSIKSNTPFSSAAKENASNASEKKENQGNTHISTSQQNPIKQSQYQASKNSNRYNYKGTSPQFNSASSAKTANLDNSFRKNDLPNQYQIKSRVAPFTPGRRDLSLTPNRLQALSQKSQSQSLSLQNNNKSINSVNQDSEKKINEQSLEKKKENEQENKDNKQIEKEDVLLSKDDFKSYMIQKVQNLQQDTINIKNVQNVETPKEQISKQQFDSFMQKYKSKVNKQVNIGQNDQSSNQIEVKE